jgi:hypothetical protein
MTRTLIEKLGLSMLARDGIAAVWEPNVAAAEAYRTGLHCGIHFSGSPVAAKSAWLRAEGERAIAF